MADARSLHREMFDVIETRDFERLAELYHPDYRYESSDGTTGDAEVGLQVAEMYTSAFPDLQLEIRHEFACGADTSVLEVTARGTHEGDLEGIAPTGRRVEVDLCNVIEVRDGKVVAEREYFDQLTMLRQLGVAD